MMGEPFSDEQLIAFASGELSAAEATAVARHAASCPNCAATIKRYQSIRDLVRNDDGVDPPPATLARAGALMSRDARYKVQNASVAFPGRRIFASAATAVVLLLFVFGLTQGVQVAAAAAESSLPGDAIYPLKTMIENVRLAVATDAADQVQLHLELVQTRLREIQMLAAQKRYGDMEAASAAFQAQVDETMKSLNVLAASDPQGAAQAASKAQQSFAQASLVLNTLLADAPVSQRPSIERAAAHSDSSASTVRGRMSSATSTPTSSATPTDTSEPPTGTPANTDTPRPTATETLPPSTDTPSATPVPAAPLATPSDQAKSPPGQNHTPPGQVNTPPGQAMTPPGQAKTPPGQDKTPPGQVNTPPGQDKTPPGQVNTPPGQGKTPPGQAKTPPGHK